MVVGLTGGIGSGKSTVAKMLAALGVPVYNSDIEAKSLMVRSKVLKRKIIALLGEQSYKGAALNRRYIASRVFNDRQLLQQLNELVHPAVRKHFVKWCKKQDCRYVVQETALLFENGSNYLYDKTILVTAPKEIRINRIVERDGSTRKQVLERMKNQMTDEEKLPLADFVIENNDLSNTELKTREVNDALLAYC